MNHAPQKVSAALQERRLSVLPASALWLVCCNGGDGPTIEPKLSELTKIMNVACSSFSVCHQNANMAYGNLKLSGGDAYCSLTGKMAGTTYLASARAEYPQRVVPGDRNRSFLYKKLRLTDAEMGRDKPYGARMPQGGKLEPHEIEAFGKWIDEGAKDDTGSSVCP